MSSTVCCICMQLPSFPNTVCWRDFLFHICIFLAPWLWIHGPYKCQFISGLSFLFHWSMWLGFYLYIYFCDLIKHFLKYSWFTVWYLPYSKVTQSASHTQTHTHTHIYVLILFSIMLYHKIGYSSLCYTVGTHFFIPSKCNSFHLLTLNLQSIPLPPTHKSVFYVHESVDRFICAIF